MLKHLNRFSLDSKEWGRILILRPVPLDGNIWGDLDCLRDTLIGKLIPIVSGEAFSNALHGYITPLMNEIGPHPHGLLKQIPDGFRICGMYNNCLMYDSKICLPCPKTPECYVPPNIEPKCIMAAAAVILSWVEGRYVIVVEGNEFSLG